MPLMPAEFASRLLAEAQQTHPWLHHRLFRMIVAGELTREQVRRVVREQGCFFSERALTILARIAVTDEEQKRGLLALRRAITARRICADGMYEAFVAR